jgi:hypothetical protein
MLLSADRPQATRVAAAVRQSRQSMRDGNGSGFGPRRRDRRPSGDISDYNAMSDHSSCPHPSRVAARRNRTRNGPAAGRGQVAAARSGSLRAWSPAGRRPGDGIPRWVAVCPGAGTETPDCISAPLAADSERLIRPVNLYSEDHDCFFFWWQWRWYHQDRVTSYIG